MRKNRAKTSPLVVFVIMSLAALAVMTIVLGCTDAQEGADRVAVNRQQDQYRRLQPVPYFEHSQELDAATQLYQARNENVRTWTVWRSDMGQIEGHCASVGYPIPYDVQLTNPLKPTYVRVAGPGTGVSGVVEQAEPNGLYSSHNSIATWVRQVRKDGSVTPIYVEGKVTCYPYPVRVNYKENRVYEIEDVKASVTLKNHAPE